MASFSNPFDVLMEREPKTKAKKKTKAKQEPKKSNGGNNAASNANGTGKPTKRGKRRSRSGRREPTRRQGPKREFDKQSGTGRGKEVSKKGHGKGGWGKQDEFAGNPNEPLNPPRKQEDAAPAEVAAPAEDAAPVVPVRPKTPEPVKLSLEEHLAAKAAAKAELDVFEHQEVVMGAQWGKVTAMHSDDDDYEKVERKVHRKKKNKKKGQRLSLQDLNSMEIAPVDNGGSFHQRRNGRGNRSKKHTVTKKSDFPALGR